MAVASLAVLLWLISYSAWCIGSPFTPAGKLRLGRRLWLAWRHGIERGRR